MVEVDSNCIEFIDRVTQKRIEKWCDQSDISFREMSQQIKAERGPNIVYQLHNDGVYVVRP